MLNRDPRFSAETLSFLRIMMEGASEEKTRDVKTSREQIESMHAKINGKIFSSFQGTLKEEHLTVNSTEIPITIYTPVNANPNKLVIYYHGGGWTVCSRKTHQAIVNTMADATKTVWISVEYRLGPEYKFPIWLDDAREAARYILQNKQAYGVESTAKVGVAGDSAGAMLSASICRALKDISFQILVYGIYDLRRTTPAFKEFVHQAYVLTPELLDWFSSSAFANMEDITDPRASVLLNTSFEGLPPCLFIIAELDPLRDESYAYQKVLQKAGVKTQLVLVKGVIHSFFSLPGIFPNACAEATDNVQKFMASL